MLENNERYYPYSSYLKNKYGQKVYKLPVNLPVTCPNRIDSTGCSFCAEVGTGFEAMDNSESVSNQLISTKEYISKRYNAKKYIAYFQNYTNTFMDIDLFKKYIDEAVGVEDIVEISISTRPDCIGEAYLDYLKHIKEKTGIEINVELGLQTINYHTLDKINRGHGIGAFIGAVNLIKAYGFTICVHLILNLPYDTDRDIVETAEVISALPIDIVKLHSLYIPYNTVLCNEYENAKITICSVSEYINRLISFLELTPDHIAIERLFSRVPEDDACFSNWGISWWKLKDMLLEEMYRKDSYQGKAYVPLHSKALTKGGFNFGKK